VKYAGDGSEITSDNRPKSKIFEWFFDPLMVIKDQIKSENFTEEEEAYLEKQVLLISDPKRIKENLIRLPPLSERKQAEIEAFARRYFLSSLLFNHKRKISPFLTLLILLQGCKESQNRYQGTPQPSAISTPL
jgi:hypothetical protein